MNKKHEDLFSLFRFIGVIIALIIGVFFDLWALGVLIFIGIEILIYFYFKNNKK